MKSCANNTYKLFIYLIFISIIANASVKAQVTSLGKAVKYLSEKIASDEFSTLKKSNNDLALLDSIYKLSLRYHDSNISEALLSVTFAAIPYNKIPITIPLINLKFDIPLVSISEPGFTLKNKNLPGELFFDSPHNSLGDRDKAAHFFGSAFLAYHSRIFDLTEIIGIFVEDFEETFYVQSSVDIRDLRTDYLGNIFGKTLRKNKEVLPSEVFAVYPLIYFRYNL